MAAGIGRISLLALALVVSSVCRAQAWLLDPAVAPQIVNEYPALQDVAVAPIGDDRFFAYGPFTHVAGAATGCLARIGPDGKADTPFVINLASNERVSIVVPLIDGRSLAVVDNAGVYPRAPASLGVTDSSPFGNLPPASSDEQAIVSRDASGAAVIVRWATTATTLRRLLSDGRRDPVFAPIDCDAAPRLTSLADGRVLVWGGFFKLGGLARNSLARLNADGTLDSTFAPSLAPRPVAITAADAAPDGSVVVCGYSNPPNGGREYYFARFDAQGTLDPDFAPNTDSATPVLLTVQSDGSVVAGGGAMPLARYTPAGARDASFELRIPSLRGIVRIASLPNRRLAVEASVDAANGYRFPAVYIVTADGEVEVDVQKLPGATNTQRLLSVMPDGRLLVLQGSSSFSISLGEAVATSDPAVASSAANADTTAVVVTPIYTLPQFSATAFALAGPGGVAPLRSSFLRRSTGQVSRIEADASGRVIVTGTFTHIDGQPRPGLARFLASGALDRAFVPPACELLLVPPDGRPIVRLGGIARLLDDGSRDPGFSVPSGRADIDFRMLAAAPDGRLLASAFEPSKTSEANLKLFWLGETGSVVQTLPTRFGGFGWWGVIATLAGGTTTSSTTTGTGTTGTVASDTSVGAITTAAGSVLTTPPGTNTPAGPVTIGPGGGNIYVVNNPFGATQILPDNRVLLTGNFQTVDGINRAGVAWLKPDGSLDGPKSSPAAYNTRLYARPLPDGRALVYPSNWDGYRFRDTFARVRDDGSIDPTFQVSANALSYYTRPLADGSLFSNGRRYSVDAVLDRNFAPIVLQNSVPSTASVAALTGSYLWIGGGFDQIDGQPRAALARFEAKEIVGIAIGPQSQAVPAGRDAVFEVVLGTTRPATYQWMRNGEPVSGATAATLRAPTSRPGDGGAYTVAVAIEGVNAISSPAALTVTPNYSRLVNFSALGVVASDTPQVAGFVCAEAPSRPVFLRAIGYGFTGVGSQPRLPMPILKLYQADRLIAENRGGGLSEANAALAYSLRATAYGVNGRVEWGAVLLPSLSGGAFTATVVSGDGLPGANLLEFYDSGSSAAVPLLRNLSIRGQTRPGLNVLTAGFVISGNGPVRLLIRGLGPALPAFGIVGAITDPSLTVYAGGERVASNSVWGDDSSLAEAARRSGAFPLSVGGRDAAVLLNLEPGNYLAQLASASGATGTGMIEIYVIDN